MPADQPEPTEPTADAFRRGRALGDWRELWAGDRSFPLPRHPGWIGGLKLKLKRFLRRLVGGSQADLWERQRLFNLRLLEEAESLTGRDAEIAGRFAPLEGRLAERIDRLGRDLQTVQDDLAADIGKAQDEAGKQLLEAKENLLVYIQANTDFLKEHDKRVRRLEDFLKDGIEEVNEHTDGLFARVDQKFDDYRRQSRRMWGDLQALMAAARVGGGEAGAAALRGAARELDYVDLERLFRGREAEIGGRIEPYLEILEGRGEVLDLGCGRGEALELMRERGIPARGVDGNAEMVALCRSKGLAADELDLFEALEATEPASLGGVVSFHVIEHLQPAGIERLVRLAWAALAPGGVLALETPSPLSLVVAARNFWLDPTHVRPVHPSTLKLTFERAGFEPVERLDLQPFADSDRLPEIDLAGLPDELLPFAQQVNRLRDDLDALLFGFQDYGLVGTKPADPSSE